MSDTQEGTTFFQLEECLYMGTCQEKLKMIYCLDFFLNVNCSHFLQDTNTGFSHTFSITVLWLPASEGFFPLSLLKSSRIH
jgi:hypothetical protein